MNTIKYKTSIKLLVTGFMILVSGSSCKKDFFNVNTNPNYPADAPVNYLLPSAEAGIAHAIGNDLKIFGGIWAQYWTQSSIASQYRTYEQYSPQSNDFDRPWSNFYSDALEDLSKIIAKSNAAGQYQYVAVAKILQAYAYQVLTDNFGDIPFKESISAESGILSPHYDSQSSIYDGIIALVKEGIGLIDTTQTGKANVPASEDLLLGGDMTKWKKFGYTLELKMYLRLSEIDPSKSQNGVQSLPASPSAYLGPGDEVKINYLNAGGNFNPLYSSIIQLNSVQNLVASETCIDFMNTYSDPRIDIFYDASSSGQIGNPQGDYDLTNSPVSLPGTVTGGNVNDVNSAVAPVKFMTGYESFFLQAEAAARGWTSGDAQALYQAGITENFESYGLPDSLASQYFAQDTIAFLASGSTAAKIRQIIIQKWVAMCGNQTDEAWIESRRTNYPDFFSISAHSAIGNRFPERMFYPSIEVTTNGNFPGQKNIYDKVWWDAN